MRKTLHRPRKRANVCDGLDVSGVHSELVLAFYGKLEIGTKLGNGICGLRPQMPKI
jgi:hypothetical protein